MHSSSGLSPMAKTEGPNNPEVENSVVKQHEKDPEPAAAAAGAAGDAIGGGGDDPVTSTTEPPSAQGCAEEIRQAHSAAAASVPQEVENEAAVPESRCFGGCMASIKQTFNTLRVGYETAAASRRSKSQSQPSDAQQEPKESGSSVAVPHPTSSGTPQSASQTMLSAQSGTRSVPATTQTLSPEKSQISPKDFHFVILPRATQVPPKGSPSPIHN